ncbi:hypothetical protein OG895_18945 [Streptomyces sp. NBC_00201]|uniref:hypothetical protein n=1 Tax=Streptomyces sp. NBC_00201 TaxID=2975679 RepID=UPI00225301D9|nr:hypothetical protein [Streptomyces sp. NBC_00201]MCX5247259.1 hypothetical protein [Streptomyces sp. NBC_00201]
MLRGTPRPTWTHGRRGALIGASAAVVCLGTALAACGGGGPGGGYVAVGAAGGTPQASGTAVKPTGRVMLVPLDGDRKEGSGGAGSGDSTAGSGGTGSGGTGSGREDPADAGGSPGTSTAAPVPTADDATSRRTASGSPSATPAPSPSPAAPAGPADLSWGEPVRKATDQRWCEDVSLAFTNSGGTAVRSGRVTFGTHVIGALGIDWATVESAVKLPAPIGAGARKKKTWTVCVDAWRVPLGMRIETRDVAVQWK